MRPRRDTCANHNRGARTTRKTATPSRAERCGQVRVRERVSKQVRIIEHASVSCAAAGQAVPSGLKLCSSRMLIANYELHAPSRPGRRRGRGAVERRTGPGGVARRVRGPVRRTWRGTSTTGTSASRGAPGAARNEPARSAERGPRCRRPAVTRLHGGANGNGKIIITSRRVRDRMWDDN